MVVLNVYIFYFMWYIISYDIHINILLYIGHMMAQWPGQPDATGVTAAAGTL